MRKICLTEAQRIEARHERVRRLIGDRLASVKNRERVTNKEMGHALGISHETIAKLLAAEDVHLSFNTTLKILDIAGLEIKEKENRS